MRQSRLHFSYILPLFCKKGTTHKISTLQAKQEGHSILHMTNAFRHRISPTYLGYSWRCSCHPFTYHRRPLVEWFTTHNSIYFKVVISPFLLKRGDIKQALTCTYWGNGIIKVYVHITTCYQWEYLQWFKYIYMCIYITLGNTIHLITDFDTIF
jgi:hypothetical protein